MPNADHKTQAMDAVGAAREVHEEAWIKLGKVMARKRLLGEDVSDENRLRARASQRITFYNRLLLELEAAASVVAAPSVEEIAETRALVQKVQGIAVADAMTSAGLQLIADALETASGPLGKIEKT